MSPTYLVASAIFVLGAMFLGRWFDKQGGQQDGCLDFLFGEEGLTIVALILVILNAIIKG